MNRTKAKAIIAAFERDHNHSWYEEIYLRNKDTLDDTAIFYRGNSLSYKHLFDRMKALAAAMQSFGVKKGAEIPICLSNSPELVYVMGAASMLGAKINVFSASFPLDYIKDIIDGCDSCLGFFEDNHFAQIHTAIEATPLKRYVLCSLGDSLPPTASPQMVEGHSFVNFTSSVSEWSDKNSKVTWFYDFLRSGEDHTLLLHEKVTLDDEFSVTYTSGSTNALRPKAIIQRVRSFCVIGRFHDADVMHGMKFKNIRGIAIIPPHSNTDLISSISDTLMQGAVLAMEPVYNERFFLDALLLNKPNFVSATCSFWLTVAKQLRLEPQRYSTKLPFLLFAFAVGEELGINEERFLNKTMRRADAGKAFHHLPVSPFCFSVAGGDCEHGSILYRLFRAVMNPAFLSSERRYGMTPFDFVDIAVLDAEGNRLGPNQTGRLVANSPCTMKCYKNNPSATDKFFIRDNNGNFWGDMSVYGYIDKHGKVYMRNRILQKAEGIPPFEVSDEILKERAVLSCVVVQIEDNYVAHIELLPDRTQKVDEVLIRARKRCEKTFGSQFAEKLLFRLHSGTTSFQLTGSGKRNLQALIAEGNLKVLVDNCAL